MVIIMVIISSSFSQELLRTMRTLPADRQISDLCETYDSLIENWSRFLSQ